MIKTLLVPLLVLLSACVGTPNLDTNAKKLLAAEISYSETAQLALVSRDRMSESTRADVKELLENAHTALVAARQALDIGSQVDFSSSLSTANSLIRTLRPILESLEDTSEYRIQHYTFA